MADEVTIRRATRADADALGAMGAALMRAHVEFDAERFLHPGADAEADYAAFLAPFCESDEAVVLIAERAGVTAAPVVTGYVYAAIEPAAFKELRDRAGFIHDLVVVEDSRGLGVGQRLLEAGVAWLTERGVPRVILWTAARNHGAQRLFARHGFRQTMIEMTREAGKQAGT